MLLKQCNLRKFLIDTNKKHNISDNINLILNTYRSLFFKLLLRVFNVVRLLRPCHAGHARRQTAWKRKDAGICRVRSS